MLEDESLLSLNITYWNGTRAIVSNQILNFAASDDIVRFINEKIAEEREGPTELEEQSTDEESSSDSGNSGGGGDGGGSDGGGGNGGNDDNSNDGGDEGNGGTPDPSDGCDNPICVKDEKPSESAEPES
jgi:hypothetical protein